MENIYNSLKLACLNIKNEIRYNPVFLFVLLLVITIPLPLGFNNVCLVLLIFVAFWKYKKQSISFTWALLLPVLLFLLMALSTLWSIDLKKTVNALSKEIAFLLIPCVFAFSQKFTATQLDKIKKYYSYAMVCLAAFFIIRALVRYSTILPDPKVFFYHGDGIADVGLVPNLLNAIHVSVYMALAFFWFLTKEHKSKTTVFCMLFIFGFLLLLSSKNIVIVTVLLTVIYLLFYSNLAKKIKLGAFFILASLLVFIFTFGKIKSRIQIELQSNINVNIEANVAEDLPEGVNIITVYQAWHNERFTPNDFFPGTAMRVYQARLFFEFLNQEPIFWKGFGLNAAQSKIEEKGIQNQVFLGNETQRGYQTLNFHNQYIQIFAELGIFGLIILIGMLLVNLKIAMKHKDFVHFAFAILMISLFLTESFLSRQRGIVFFTAFYCLFNSRIIHNNSKGK
ncbi:MAG: O-antigen ligase family protein [Flavobacteriaceae bacterium]|jgi:O-antigen ligase|nr:O-antigen ligase family protein [Flavobacteriaceae bacterium]